MAAAVLIFLFLPFSFAQNVYVATPNVIRVGVEEKIAIAVDGVAAPQHFELYIQDHPGKRKNLSHTFETFLPANPKITSIKIDPADIPDYEFGDYNVRNYVSLIVHSNIFHKEVVLPISYKSGYVFLQTDKPIYTPQQRVNFRIIPLNDDGRPSSEKIKFQIKNPKGVPVLEKDFNGKLFITPEPYKFPSYPILGVWSASVLYGHKFLQNATIQFELQEYVLPTFTVKLRTQEVILPADESISVVVEAKFVYGKPVGGKVVLKLGVKGDTPNVIYFAVLHSEKLIDGIYRTNIPTNDLKNHKRVGWFPEIEGSKFVVEATVTDDATGQKEIATDASGRFSSSPFTISFKQSLSDFKPGLVSIIQADVSYVNGKPAGNIKTVITATSNNNPLKITNEVSVTNNDGRASFEVLPEIHHDEIDITVKTDEPRYAGSQSVGHHKQYSYKSLNKAYIAITRNNKDTPKAGKMFTEIIYYEPASITDIYFMVVSKGKIILIQKMHHGMYKMHRIEFMVTQDMVPSFRIIAFAEYKNELIADSLRIGVVNECDSEASIDLKPVFNVKEPGSNGKILIEGSKSTLVGLLAVDSAVYALSDRDRLTKQKMFQAMENHDLGCGPGGGLTTNSVLRNAGIVMTTNHFDPDSEATISACEEKVRQKRQAISTKLEEYKGTLKECCALGISHDNYNRGCAQRAEIVKKYLADEDRNCSNVFLHCCEHGQKKDLTRMKLSEARRPFVMGRMGSMDKFDFIATEDEEILEKGTLVRSDFRETWIFDDLVIGPDGKAEMPVSLLHSITTWIVQAVGVSQAHGMCIAEPKSVESFKKVFVQLNLPYSVVRNEQVEIQATVFNYGDKNLTCVVYMYGVKDLCSSAQENEKSERKRLVVPPHSGQTVPFPIIPLVKGIYDIQVVALSPDGSDIVHRKLNVVAEGETVIKYVTVKLDPSNQQRRSKRHITKDEYSDSIDDTQNLQVTAIKLRPSDGFIPGTESCIISVLGDQFGPTVQTSLENPDKLLNRPNGCAEQSMVNLAPTLYTMKYLKSVNKITPEREAKGYSLIREGYDLVLSYRKDDGSYGAWITTPSSTWLTAFIIKVFCQANKLVHISEEVMCSGIKWLIAKQAEDGSFIEHHPIYHTEMMGGVTGKAPLTAFVLITLQECTCEIKNFNIVKARAMAYLEDHLGDVVEPLPVAITAYALAITDSELKQAINDKLLSMSKYDEDTNMLHWETGSNAYDIEASSYALLAQLQNFNMDRSNSIVNWLNTQQMSSGSFKSTQDTVVALQALSEYAIQAKTPTLNLVSNITSSNDRNLVKTFTFVEKNARVLQEHKVDKIGGMLFVNTAGHGVGLLSVKLQYNIPYPPEKLCKFDISVNASEEKENDVIDFDDIDDESISLLREDQIRGVRNALDVEPPELVIDPRNRPLSRIGAPRARLSAARSRTKREDKTNNSNLVLKLTVCTRYLGNHDPGMSIVDVGIFSGFRADEEDLKKLVNSQVHEIERYEISSRGIVLYLRKVPIEETYCFAFRVIRDYIVGNTRASIVKVYAYYSPDESCTVFYSPDQNSPMLRKICSKGICQCAEGGCPPKTPFANTDITRDKLKLTACEDHDYVWIIQVDYVEKKSGFLNIMLLVIEVLKDGIEKASLVENKDRLFLARDNCESAALFPGKQYLIMGKDGTKYENDQGVIQHRYLFDKTSKIHIWTDIQSAKKKKLMRALHWLKGELKKGCDL